MTILIMPTEQEPSLDAVRGWIRGALRDLPLAVRLQTEVVADELVSNARRHGLAPYVLRLDVRDDRRALLVSVDDCAPPRGDWAASGGLVLVGGLSERWGVEPRRQAKTVWAELTFDRPVLDLDTPEQPVPRPGRRGRRARP